MDRTDTTPRGAEVFRGVISTEVNVDPLALFESEADPPTLSVAATHAHPLVSRPDTVAAQSRNPIGLDQVLDRLDHIAWQEGVAIVESLCSVLNNSSGVAAGVPELSGISITVEGAVVVHGGGPQEPPGPRLARTLHALTPSSAIPVPLRLFVTKWISFAEPHSIADFAAALAYYARPDGGALIQGVYERVVAAASTQRTVQPAKADTAPAAGDLPRPRRHRRSRWLAASAILISGALMSAWMLRGPLFANHSFSFGVAQMVSNTADMVRRVAARASEAESPAERAAPAPLPETKRPARAVVPSRSTEPRATSRPASAPPEGQLSSMPDDVSSLRAVVTAAAPVLLSSGHVGPEAGAEPNRVDQESDSSRIYSSADADVSPPEMRYPQLPAPFLSGVQAEMNTIELVVSETGTVERVRLVSTPRRMADMMILSGAKAWVFQPATEGGRSVRYRLVLSWATP